jgi:hypothetical protein
VSVWLLDLFSSSYFQGHNFCQTVSQGDHLSLMSALSLVFSGSHAFAPVICYLEFPAGSVVPALVSFHNKGQNAFTVLSIESSLRHLQDFSYFIQNVSDFNYLAVLLISSAPVYLVFWH